MSTPTREPCPKCDMPRASKEDWDKIPGEPNADLCWATGKADCRNPAVDWRSRCLQAESALVTLYKAIGPMATNSDGRRDEWTKTQRFLHEVLEALTNDELAGVRDSLGDETTWIAQTVLAADAVHGPAADPMAWKPARAEDQSSDPAWAAACELARSLLNRRPEALQAIAEESES